MEKDKCDIIVSIESCKLSTLKREGGRERERERAKERKIDPARERKTKEIILHAKCGM